MTSGIAVNKLLSTLENEQEIMAMLADMVIEIYAVECGLLRANKLIALKDEKKAEYHIAAVKIYLNDLLPKITHWAKQILTFVEEGKSLASLMATVDKLDSYQPVDTVTLRRFIADKIIKAKRYPF